MNNKHSDIMLNRMGRSLWARIGLSLFLFIFQIATAQAGGVSVQGIDIATLPGDKLQIQLEMNGAAVEPKVFHTDNPARIALDFPGVKNALDKKEYPINQGAARNIYVAEGADRVRIVLNLVESVPFDTKVIGNKVQLTLTSAKAVMPERSAPVVQKPATTLVSSLMPEQVIRGLDFKRGERGEGRILVSLANPNTIVNSKEEGGKVVISFLNTQLPGNLEKKLDVSDFATPVRSIDAVSSNNDSAITVSLQNSLYDYSLFQSEGLLTVEFRPITAEEKEAVDKKRAKYTGDRLSLNFQEIDVRSVIAVLAEFTGQNVVAGDDVTGTVTLKLDDVPWDEALDFIMMTKDLEKYETGNVTLIAPQGKIKKYKEEQQKTETVVEQLEPLVTEYLKINYAKAEDFRNLLYGQDASAVGSCSRITKSELESSGGNQSQNQGQNQYQNQFQNPFQNQGQDQGQNQGFGDLGNNSGSNNDRLVLLSARGSAVVDSRTNTLIVRETAKRLEEVKKLIRKLDIPVRQVMIESRIVIASNTFAKELGVRFGVAKQAEAGSGKVFAVGGRGTRGNGNAQVDEDGNIGTLNDALVDLATTSNPYGALGMTLARGADYVLNLELSALQDQGRGELISNPRVMTSDRCLAVIQQGAKIPYLSSSANTGTNTVFVDAVLQLGVLPQITPNGSVIMGLYITKNTLGEEATELGDRMIDKRELRTSVQVNDGETVVLGGVFEEEINNDTNKVPFFADLPGIGFLFKRTFNQDDKRELLIFVTPKIVKDALSSY
ncbi:type IV pilus secretin family protein [Methylobacter sp. BlB1]|uniref:type IV pilus secretin family protein n=1 Tax=unclassified Methylobacter TaxID=2635283 RepID=UPI0018935352|nr:type IV pilus secretin family protein [Methylobacter sp. BlB1]MBF6647162.1 type IV pilus secretin PilQ [Methylobacter sp. BlB1]